MREQPQTRCSSRGLWLSLAAAPAAARHRHHVCMFTGQQAVVEFGQQLLCTCSRF
jgi:hypothetical protein